MIITNDFVINQSKAINKWEWFQLRSPSLRNKITAQKELAEVQKSLLDELNKNSKIEIDFEQKKNFVSKMEEGPNISGIIKNR